MTNIVTHNVTKHLRIFGRVQGVNFRTWSVGTAQNLGLTGWVRNLKDGSVEAIATGPKDIVERFIGSCYQGPEKANVEAVQVTDGIDENLDIFEYRETA